MTRAGSLRRQIILQFVIILLPLLAVLIYQTATDYLHALATDRASRHAGLAGQAETQFKQFVDGIVDAVDSGTLAPSARAALDASAATLTKLANADPRREVSAVGDSLRLLQSLIPENAALAQLSPHRSRVNDASARTAALARDARTLEDTIVREAVAASRTQLYYVIAAALCSCLLTLLFIRRMIKGLTDPLQRAVAAAIT
jgi:methyl-accepting chemotaxis protein